MPGVKQGPSPRSHAELFSRMGQFAFVSSHIPFFAKISAPLRHLMVSENFYWDKECHLAFETLKLATRMNIKNFAVKPGLPLFVFTDASKVALGVVICQIFDTHLNIVACQSRIFRKEDRVKSAVVRECIGLMFALKVFEVMFRNHTEQVFVITDASSLVYITKNKSVQSKYYTYALFISSFQNVTIVHCGSKHMYLADVLSRCFLDFVLTTDESEQSMVWAKLQPALPDYNSLKVLPYNKCQT